MLAVQHNKRKDSKNVAILNNSVKNLTGFPKANQPQSATQPAQHTAHPAAEKLTLQRAKEVLSALESVGITPASNQPHTSINLPLKELQTIYAYFSQRSKVTAGAVFRYFLDFTKRYESEGLTATAPQDKKTSYSASYLEWIFGEMIDETENPNYIPYPSLPQDLKTLLYQILPIKGKVSTTTAGDLVQFFCNAKGETFTLKTPTPKERFLAIFRPLVELIINSPTDADVLRIANENGFSLPTNEITKQHNLGYSQNADFVIFIRDRHGKKIDLLAAKNDRNSNTVANDTAIHLTRLRASDAYLLTLPHDKRAKYKTLSRRKFEPTPLSKTPYFNNALLNTYQTGQPIDRLLIVEGEKKAFALSLLGVPAIGIAGIQNFSVESPELLALLEKVKPTKYVILFDSDATDRHSTKRLDNFRTAVTNTRNRILSLYDKQGTSEQPSKIWRENTTDAPQIFYIQPKDRQNKGVDDLIFNRVNEKENIKNELISGDLSNVLTFFDTLDLNTEKSQKTLKEWFEPLNIYQKIAALQLETGKMPTELMHDNHLYQVLADNEYLSDMITPENFKNSGLYLIRGGTGIGKTYFVAEIKRFLSQIKGRNVCVVSANRTTLQNYNQYDFRQFVESKKEKSDFDQTVINIFGTNNAYCVTYKSLRNFLTHLGENVKNWVFVFDEAHQLNAPYSEVKKEYQAAFEAITDLKVNNSVILTSANQIYYKCYKTQAVVSEQNSFHFIKPSVRREFKRCLSGATVIDLINEILEAKKEGRKALVYINRKNDKSVFDFIKPFLENAGLTINFFDSTQHGKIDLTELKTDVTFTTSALVAGKDVNTKNLALIFYALDPFTPNDLVQFFGRGRAWQSHTYSLLLAYTTENNFKSLLNERKKIEKATQRSFNEAVTSIEDYKNDSDFDFNDLKNLFLTSNLKYKIIEKDGNFYPNCFEIFADFNKTLGTMIMKNTNLLSEFLQEYGYLNTNFELSSQPKEIKDTTEKIEKERFKTVFLSEIEQVTTELNTPLQTISQPLHDSQGTIEQDTPNSQQDTTPKSKRTDLDDVIVCVKQLLKVDAPKAVFIAKKWFLSSMQRKRFLHTLNFAAYVKTAQKKGKDKPFLEFVNYCDKFLLNKSLTFDEVLQVLKGIDTTKDKALKNAKNSEVFSSRYGILSMIHTVEKSKDETTSKERRAFLEGLRRFFVITSHKKNSVVYYTFEVNDAINHNIEKPKKWKTDFQHLERLVFKDLVLQDENEFSDVPF
jgi:Type III restriction enzyme, res subunit/Domain of unknown function (DUF3854)